MSTYYRLTHRRLMISLLLGLVPWLGAHAEGTVDWKSNPTKLQVPAGQTTKIQLSDLVINATAGTKLVFALVNTPNPPPDWVTLDASDPSNPLLVASSVPTTLTTYSFGMSVKQGVSDIGRIAEFDVTVTPPPPNCVSPINLPVAEVNHPYSEDLSQFCKDPSGLKLNYTFANGGPAWASVSPTGTMSGHPGTGDVGPNQWTLNVTNGTNSASATVNVTVVEQGVKWTQNPIQLPLGQVGVGVSADLTTDLSNPDQLPLTCILQGNSDWATVSNGCKLTGTPALPDLGDQTVQVQVSDGSNSPSTTVAITIAPAQIALTPDAKEQAPYTNDLKPFTPSSRPYQFAKLSGGPGWIQVGGDGKIGGTPSFVDVSQSPETINVQAVHPTGKVSIAVTVTVDKVPQRPACTNAQFNADVGSQFSGSVAGNARDPHGENLTFTPAQAPPWMQVAANGALSGTPTAADTAQSPEVFVVTATNTDQLSCDIQVTVNINQLTPKCQNPINLPNATVGKIYTQSIASYCTDPSGTGLKFSGNGGWVTFTGSGGVIGTPAVSDSGPHAYSVQVANAKGSVTVTVNIAVDCPQPVWTQSTIALGQATVGQAFAFNLVPYVQNPLSGSQLTFSESNGPAWLQGSSGGNLSGTPALSDVGQYTIDLTVSNGCPSTAQASGYGSVINHVGPQWQISPLEFTVTIGQPFNVNLNDSKYVISPSGDALTFSPQVIDTWVSLSLAGQLSATPQLPQLGDHTYSVTATDTHEASTPDTLILHVVKPACQDPVWNKDPVLFTVNVNKSFQADLSQYVTDPAHLPLTFQIVWGVDPEWANVAQSGTMSGTPIPADLGDNSFLISATDSSSCTANGTVIVTVNPGGGPVDDEVGVDDTVPWATAQTENLWIVDSATTCGKQSLLLQAFETSMSIYFDDLNNAKVEHAGIYVSPNPNPAILPMNRKISGTPIRGRDGSTLLVWNESNIESDFIARISGFKACSSCSSAIWAQYLFYGQLTGLAEYQHTYFLPQVPMDTVIITDHTDSYQHYLTASSPQTPVAFAQTFMGLHAAAQKPYRIDVIASKCAAGDHVNAASDGDDSMTSDAQADPYRDLTSTTGGLFWEVDNQSVTVATALQQLADSVKLRALVTSKKEIPLSKTPDDVSKIQVLLGGVPLAANQWQYNQSKNAVDIFWQKIDLSTIKPGEKIEIKYTAKATSVVAGTD